MLIVVGVSECAVTAGFQTAQIAAGIGAGFCIVPSGLDGDQVAIGIVLHGLGHFELIQAQYDNVMEDVY